MSLPSDLRFLTFYFPLASVPSYCLLFFPSFRLSIFPSFLVSLFTSSPLPFFPPCPFLLSLFPPFLFLFASFLAYSLRSSFIPSFPFHLSTFPPSPFLPPRPFFFPSTILRHFFSTPLMHSPLARTTFAFLHSCLPSVLYALIPSLGPTFLPNLPTYKPKYPSLYFTPIGCRPRYLSLGT